MTDYSDNDITAAKTLSKAIASLYISMMLLSTYVIQQSFNIDVAEITTISSESQPGAVLHLGTADLLFYQPTMSILWPLVLSMLCLVFYYFIQRRKVECVPCDAREDPFYPFAKSAWNKILAGKTVLVIISALPFTAIFIHLLALTKALVVFNQAIEYTMITLYIMIAILATHGVGMLYTIFLPIVVKRASEGG